jgi:hypothetical protein
MNIIIKNSMIFSFIITIKIGLMIFATIQMHYSHDSRKYFLDYKYNHIYSHI